jgi:PqqD family protein of HPr-rel-A system
MRPATSADSRFAIRSWDDGVVVFDRMLGATHALDRLTGRVFCACLEGRETSDADLLETIRSLLPDGAESELLMAIEQARTRLATAGLLAVH